MKKSSACTLAEVLITLAIIGVVAAMTIPGVIVRTNQQEFKTGFRKAISVLNQAVTMNMALDNVTHEYLTSQQEVHDYLIKRMNVVKSNVTVNGNKCFYTADGFRYEIPSGAKDCTVNTPCTLGVDVNGDRGPTTPSNNALLSKDKYPKVADNRVIDYFTIQMTDVSIQPKGDLAKYTMYGEEKN